MLPEPLVCEFFSKFSSSCSIYPISSRILSMMGLPDKRNEPVHELGLVDLLIVQRLAQLNGLLD